MGWFNHSWLIAERDRHRDGDGQQGNTRKGTALIQVGADQVVIWEEDAYAYRM